MEEKLAELREVAMRLRCALTYAPSDGIKLSIGLVHLNELLGRALKAVEAASRHEVQA